MKSLIFVLIVVSLFLLFSIVNDSLLIAPADGTHIDQRRPEFRFIGNAVLVVDNDKDFESPIIQAQASHFYKPLTNLPIGEYYWKIRNGNVESEVREFTIDSVVATKIYNEKLFNEGNVNIGVSQGITGAAVGTLRPGEFLDVDNNKAYTSRQDE